ncbi:MAG TPA: type II toxin-antitoxin system RelE/ParE family toxin [Phycisphaerae bacterium]|nr:type II toxin-antitoxin system RelE/ParE family toxin [Phycisphaerae bacterium]
MAFKIVWSQTAVEDFKEIVEFISLDDPSSAASLAGRILTRIQRAAELPLSNRLVPEKGGESVRESILRPYRIVYQVDDARAAIQILRIWHAARGAPDLE